MNTTSYLIPSLWLKLCPSYYVSLWSLLTIQMPYSGKDCVQPPEFLSITKSACHNTSWWGRKLWTNWITWISLRCVWKARQGGRWKENLSPPINVTKIWPRASNNISLKNANLMSSLVENQCCCKNYSTAMSVWNSIQSEKHPVTEFKGCQKINRNKTLEHIM